MKERIKHALIMLLASILMIGVVWYQYEHREKSVVVRISEGSCSTIQFGRLKNDIVYIENFNMDKFIVDAYNNGYVDEYNKVEKDHSVGFADHINISGNIIEFAKDGGGFNSRKFYAAENIDKRTYKVAKCSIEYDRDKEKGYAKLAEIYGSDNIYHRYPTNIDVYSLDDDKLIYSSIKDNYYDYARFLDENVIKFRDRLSEMRFKNHGRLSIVQNDIEIHLNCIPKEERQEVYELGKDKYYKTNKITLIDKQSNASPVVYSTTIFEFTDLKEYLDGYNLIYKCLYNRDVSYGSVVG